MLLVRIESLFFPWIAVRVVPDLLPEVGRHYRPRPRFIRKLCRPGGLQDSCVENRKSVRFANQRSASEIPARFSVEV